MSSIQIPLLFTTVLGLFIHLQIMKERITFNGICEGEIKYLQ